MAGSTNLPPIVVGRSDARSGRRGCVHPDRVSVSKSLRTLARKVLSKMFILMPTEEIFVVVVFVVIGSKLSQRISGTLPNVLPPIRYQHSAQTLLAYRQC